jgi:hypothetical protein
LSALQACAGVISTNADASAFWLDDAQQAVLANEYGSDASPLFMGGAYQGWPLQLVAPKVDSLHATWTGEVPSRITA